jgi:uncharacterized protein YdeI (BOF family)
MASGPTGASDDRPMVPTTTAPPEDVGIGATGAPVPPEIVAQDSVIGSTTAPIETKPMQLQPPAPAPTTTPQVPPQTGLDTFTPPGPQTVETRDQRTQVQSGTPVNPFIQTEIKIARMAQQEALADEAQIRADVAKRSADAEEDRQAALKQEQLVQENAAERRRLALEAEMKRIRDAQKELDDNSTPPEESVGTRIARAIAISLGEFGKAFAGGSNGALAIVEADRANKLQVWKAQYHRLSGKVANAQNLYAQLRQKGLDDQTAEAAVIQKLNDRYAGAIKAVAARSESALVKTQAERAAAALQERNLQEDQKLWQGAQRTFTTVVDAKRVTKEGGADTKTKGDLIKLANDDEYIKRYRSTSTALSRFEDLVKGGAEGAALADFIAGKGGLEQGSFGPNFIDLMKKRSIFGQGVEKLRAMFAGGVDPGLLKDIKNGLAMETMTSLQKARPAIKFFRNEFHRAGIDPSMVTGGETSDEQAAAAGATRSTYQGRQ